MTLLEYKALKGVTYVHIARKCGVSQSIVRNIATGYLIPSFKLARLIEHHTFGNVPTSNWYEFVDGKPKKKISEAVLRETNEARSKGVDGRTRLIKEV